MSRSITVRQLKCAFVLALLSVLALETTAQAAELDPTAALTGKPGGLTAEQVAKQATATSFATEQKRQEVQVAAANLDKAVYDFIPRLSGSASYFRLSKVESSSLGNLVVAPGAAPGPIGPGQTLAAAPIAFDSLQNSTTFSTSLSVPLSDYVFKLFQQHAGAKAQLQGSQYSLEATRRKTAYDARALYYDWVRAELDAAVAQQNLELSSEHLSRLQALQAADSASPADVARVEATVASSERVLVQAKNLAVLQRERVAIAMHDSGAHDYQIGEDLRSPPAERSDVDDIAELTRIAERNRPELKAATFQAVAYEKQADVAHSRILPRLDVSAQNTMANPNQRYFPQKDELNNSWQVGVQLSFSASDSLMAKTQVAASLAQARGALAQRAQLLDAVRTEVTDAVLSHRSAQASLKSTARRLAAAETSYRARRERFQVGQATTIELTEAQTELVSAKLEAIQAQVSVRVARARIAYVTGRDR
ncbi:MAG TPA: TolC family protein [Polyangiaceae bacterium]|nr:TolC family protein [Polyangiaceae bacterium]